MTIKATFDSAIFGSAPLLDVKASGKAYAKALAERISEQYPDAAVSVLFNSQTSGARSTYTATSEDGETDEETQNAVYQIAQAVFNEDADWQIETAN